MHKSSKRTHERRRFPRVMAPVYYRIPRTLSRKQRVSNLSSGGVRIYSDERLDISQELDLEFFLPKGSVVRAKARVVWTKELPPGSAALYDVGMEFISLSEKTRKDLEAVLRIKK